jgi:hypothetical protein
MTGGCYCKAVRFEIDGEPFLKAQCHCRECQYFSGGQPNFFFAVPIAKMTFVSGEDKLGTYTRPDLAEPVSRQFCSVCGTPLWSLSNQLPGARILKAGVLDDPSLLGSPTIVMQTADAQPFHHMPEGIPAFPRFPG